MTPRHVILLCLAASSLCSCEKALKIVRELKSSSQQAVSSTASTTKASGAFRHPRTVPSGPIVRNLDAAGYEEFIRLPDRLTVVVFHADWCGPCKALQPVVGRMAAEYGGWVNVGRVNVDEAADLCARAGVSGIPDVRFFRDGAEVDRFVGNVKPERIREIFDQYTKDLKETEDVAVPVPASSPGNPVMEPMSKDWMPPGMQRR